MIISFLFLLIEIFSIFYSISASVDFKNQLLEWQVLVQKAEEKAKRVLKPYEDIAKSLEVSLLMNGRLEFLICLINVKYQMK